MIVSRIYFVETSRRSAINNKTNRQHLVARSQADTLLVLQGLDVSGSADRYHLGQQLP